MRLLFVEIIRQFPCCTGDIEVAAEVILVKQRIADLFPFMRAIPSDFSDEIFDDLFGCTEEDPVAIN